MHEENCFITLTYSEPNITNLRKEDFTNFIKALRREFGEGIKFFMCGEYGETGKRPHFHACLFGIDFNDKKLWSVRNGVKLYRSSTLERLWKRGYSTIGNVTFESAAYIARYCIKAEAHREPAVHLLNTGAVQLGHIKEQEVCSSKWDNYIGKSIEDASDSGNVPEYINMSRRPGLGKSWLLKYKNDILSAGKVILRNDKSCLVPRYYNNLLTEKERRAILAKTIKTSPEDQEWERLRSREICKLAKFEQLKRSMSNG